jgi:hypothetical protein
MWKGRKHSALCAGITLYALACFVSFCLSLCLVLSCFVACCGILSIHQRHTKITEPKDQEGKTRQEKGHNKGTTRQDMMKNTEQDKGATMARTKTKTRRG